MKMQCLCIQQVQAPPPAGSEHKEEIKNEKRERFGLKVGLLQANWEKSTQFHNLCGWNTEDKHKHED